MTSRRSRIAPLLVLVAALSGACASDDDGGAIDSGGSAPSTTSTTAAGDATSTTASGDDGAVTQAGTEDDPVTESGNGRSATLAVGDRLVIKLETCSSCGYSWRQTGGDPKIVALKASEPRTRPRDTSTSEPMVGGNDDHYFTFEGVAAGTTTIELGYFPPGQDTAEETWKLTVSVG